MTSAARKLLENAMALPSQDQEEVAVHLIDSLPSEESDEIEAAWKADIERRIVEVESGQVAMIPWETARHLLIERLEHGETPGDPS